MVEYEKQKQRVAVVFSASWCNTCGPFKRKLEAQGIPFLNAQMDQPVGVGLSIHTGWSEGADIMDIASAMCIRSLPTTLVFDENKELVASIVGSNVEAVKVALKG